MSTKKKRAGGKFAGRHTSVIPAARIVCDIAHDCPEVTKVVCGFITSGLRPVQGRRRLKMKVRGNSAVFVVRDNASVQEIVVITQDVGETFRSVAEACARAGLDVTSDSR